MAEDPMKRLEEQGQEAVPPIDRGFTDRLESRLRVEHSELSPTGRRRATLLLPRLGVALAVALVAIVGAVALTGRDAGVPVAVVDGDPPALADAPPTGGDADDDDLAAAEPTPTPTTVSPRGASTVAPAEAPVEQPSVAVTDSPVTTATVPPLILTPEPTAAVQPAPTATVTAAPAPEPTAQPTRPAAPTAIPERATSIPRATETAVSVPSPTPTATPHAPREPAIIELLCETRTVGDVVGVVCTWEPQVSDRTITNYEVWRSRNGDEAVVVNRQRAAAPTTYVDRDIRFGDRVTYVIRGLGAEDQVVAASVREVVDVPERP